MNFIYLSLISVGLAMDTFSISLTKGLIIEKWESKDVFKTIIILGSFQVLMSLIGFKAGRLFFSQVNNFSNFIVFSVLLFLGWKMILDAWKEFKNKKKSETEPKFNLIFTGLATSIDTLVVGSSFSLMENFNIFSFLGMVGTITSIASLVGIYLGYKTSSYVNYQSNFIGGCILVFISLKILFKTLLFS
ncbi:manganese efflux pump [uncultured Ilyobacter sp.]|uniref:manganese efflux pump MntP n=1 Tax=uncultured Ilyobacter sp. TaxID=544433 RepID=UPI0029C6AF26|nr:manganese efflux pump [uncultured Ilyobacter sp.]